MVILLGWKFIPQQMNNAVIPLIITLGSRSASCLFRVFQQEKQLK